MGWVFECRYLANSFSLSAVKLVPRSIDHSAQSNAGDCNASLDAGVSMAIPADTTGKIDITFSYTVSFVVDNSIKWSSRSERIVIFSLLLKGSYAETNFELFCCTSLPLAST